MDVVWWLVVGALVVAGFVSLIVPALPGPLLVFCGLWLGAWIDHFQRVGIWTLVLLSALMLLCFAADWIGSVLGAKKVGASKTAVAGALLGSLVGFVFGPVGVILGPFAGAAVGELIAHDDLLRAGKVGLATSIGIVVAIVAKLGLCFLMVGIFALRLLV